MGNRCDDSLPQSQTHGHPDLDLWLQVSYNHARALQVITEFFCVVSSTNAARVCVSWLRASRPLRNPFQSSDSRIPGMF